MVTAVPAVAVPPSPMANEAEGQIPAPLPAGVAAAAAGSGAASMPPQKKKPEKKGGGSSGEGLKKSLAKLEV